MLHIFNIGQDIPIAPNIADMDLDISPFFLDVHFIRFIKDRKTLNDVKVSDSGSTCFD